MVIDWTREEVEATVADYFSMLEAELRGEVYNKSAHRRALLQQLRGRTAGAVEHKHMNISAVLRDLGHPWIDGYKPYANYQRLLFEVVAERLASDDNIVRLVDQAVTDRAVAPDVQDPLAAWEEAPEREQSSGVSEKKSMSGSVHGGVKIDYLEREARNQSLGLAGEAFVLQFEAERLHRAGKEALANKIDHVSQRVGDGPGFDILSYDETGRERLIEVKTTNFGKRTPFYITQNELDCSVARHEQYHLYRVFAFRTGPRLFGLRGRLDRAADLNPVQYRAYR